MGDRDGEKSGLDKAGDTTTVTRERLREMKTEMMAQGAPEIEPENDWLIVEPNSDKTYKVPADDNGNGKIEEGETETLSKKEYYIYLYRYQVKVLQEKKSTKEREKTRYDIQIKSIDDYIKRREEEYGKQVEKFIDAQSEYEYYKAQYDEGLGRDFYPGDQQEKWLKGKIQETAGKTSKSSNKEKFLYDCYFEDIDNPVAGRQHYEDIRILRARYSDKVDIFEDEIEELESRLEANKKFLERIKKAKD